jgi:hypothetical protein
LQARSEDDVVVLLMMTKIDTIVVMGGGRIPLRFFEATVLQQKTTVHAKQTMNVVVEVAVVSL